MAQIVKKMSNVVSQFGKLVKATGFNFENKQLRTFGSSGVVWFCGKDVAKILGYENTTGALKDNVDIDDRMPFKDIFRVGAEKHHPATTNKNDLKTTYINESGLYSLIMRSKLPSAKNFKKWITSEVLPSIRKNGYYVSPDASPDNLAKLQLELDEKSKALEEANAKIAKNERTVLNLNRFTTSIQLLEKKETFYIATSPIYAQSNLFKYGGIGRTQELKNRLAVYNSGRAENDLFYFAKIFECNSYKHIEKCLSQLTAIFKDKIGGKKEMIFMRFDCLVELVEFIIDNNEKSIDFINQHIRQYVKDTIELDAIIPQPINLNRTIEHIGVNKINVAGWSDEQIRDVLIQIILRYGKAKYGDGYTPENDTQKMKLMWSDLCNEIESEYSGRYRKKWKEHLKTIIKDTKVAIGWRK